MPPELAIKAAFRRHFRELMKAAGWQCDPAVWTKKWVVNIQAFGDGANAIKYLAPYVSRSVITDHRSVAITDTHVTLRWKDRAHGGEERLSSIEGTEFVRRYLRHVLPAGMHSVRYSGFHHPTAKKTLNKLKLYRGTAPQAPTSTSQQPEAKPIRQVPVCPCCSKPMVLLGRVPALRKRPKATPPAPARGPPMS
jgi:hypothetical protein